ncbi:DUF6220 domain-containing protein [Hamadaea sp. NPDC050747]|uniref:DUF6220 domain-containing protein n=1 Tax=Hamadaea sp. NPDC050747 TaxID=3155789 RepID=UPI0033DDDCB4
MRKVFAALAGLLVLLVVAQFFFAASGGFSTRPGEEAYRGHHALGYVIFLWPIVMMIVAAIGRMPGRLIGLTAVIPALTAFQVVVAKVAIGMSDSGSGTASEIVFGLHGIGGLLTGVFAGLILRQARALARPTPAPAPAA